MPLRLFPDRHCLLALGLLCAVSLAQPLRAAEPPEDAALVDLERQIAEKPALPDLLAYAYRTSPQIQAAKAEWRAAVETYRVDTAWEDPEVMLEGMYMASMFGETSTPEDWKVTLTQPLPLPGQLSAAGRVANNEAAMARLRLDSAVRDTALRLRESYAELRYLREAKRLAAANQELLDQTRRVGESGAAGGRVALVDVMKAQAQSGQVRYDLLLAEDSARTEETRLNAILNRPPEAALGPLAPVQIRPLAYSLSEIHALAEENQEEVKLARIDLARANDKVDLTRYDTLPRLTLGASYGDTDQVQQVGVQASLSLPLWLGKNVSRMAAARAEADKARHLAQAQINDSRATIRDTYFRLQNSARLVRLYADDLIPQANRAMQTGETWFSKGQGSFTDYLETSAAWYNFHLALARAQADYAKLLARLESQAGRDLTSRDEGDAPAGEEGS